MPCRHSYRRITAKRPTASPRSVTLRASSGCERWSRMRDHRSQPELARNVTDRGEAVGRFAVMRRYECRQGIAERLTGEHLAQTPAGAVVGEPRCPLRHLDLAHRQQDVHDQPDVEGEIA